MQTRFIKSIKKNIAPSKRLFLISSLGIFLFFSFLSVWSFGLVYAQEKEGDFGIKIEQTTVKKGDPLKVKTAIYTTKGGEYIYYTIRNEEGIIQENVLGCTIPKTNTKNDTLENEKDTFLVPSLKGCDFSVIVEETGTHIIDVYYSKDKITFSEKKLSTNFTVADPSSVPLTPEPQNIDDGQTDNSDILYYPLESLPGLDKNTPIDTSETCAFAKYMNIIFRLVIGISAVLAMVMIIYGGIEYMSGGAISEKENGKETIKNALMGLVIALGAWLLLNTLNPELLDVCLDLEKVTINIDSSQLESGADVRLYESMQKDTVFRKSKYYDEIKSAVGAQFPHCLLQVAIQRESAGGTALIGHDENVPSEGVLSRRKFILSGKKADGTTFETSTTQITNSSLKNSDTANVSVKDLGLDWRFSHGIGLFQITYFGTEAKGSPQYTNQDLRELLDAQKNIALGVKRMNEAYTKCGKDIKNTFKQWHSGSCTNSNPFPEVEASLRKRLFDQCEAQK